MKGAARAPFPVLLRLSDRNERPVEGPPLGRGAGHVSMDYDQVPRIVMRAFLGALLRQWPLARRSYRGPAQGGGGES